LGAGWAACLSSLPAQLTAYAYTADDRVRVSRGSWLAPEQVLRLEVPHEGAALEAWTGKQAWPLVPDPHKPVHVLVVDDKLRRAWRASGTLVVGFATQRDSGGELTLRASLRRLDLPEGGSADFTLAQRRRTAMPGSYGYLMVAIDDITDGQTLVTVTGADGHAFVARRSMRTGEHVVVDLGDGRYVLVVRRLRNLLIGDDYATLAVVPEARFEVDRIQALLARVAAAEVTFVREGRRHGAAAAADHLRAKYEAVAGKIETVEDFILQVGSRSSTTGAPYTVVLPDGTETTAAAWLRQQAAEIERAAASSGARQTDK
jgi:hypothetical protein